MKRSGKILSFFLSGISMLLLIAMDQLSKILAVRELGNGSEFIFIPHILKLHYIENRGAAFGILEGKTYLLAILAVLICAGALYFLHRIPASLHYLPLRCCIVLLSAGAAGNAADRILRGYVIDYFETVFIDFPVFNVADIYVVCSTIFLCILILFYYKEEELRF